MSKFAVGDKVRFVEPKEYCAYVGASDNWPKVGDTGVVTGHVEHYTLVRLDNEERAGRSDGKGDWRFIDEWLEPAPVVAPAKKLRFNVGDKVRLTCVCHNGVTGVVTKVDGKYADVRIDDNGEVLRCDTKELEKVAVKRQPKVGDKIRVRTAYKRRTNAQQTEHTGVIVEKWGRLGVEYDDKRLGGWGDFLTSVEILEYLDEPAPSTPASEEAKPTILAVGTRVRLTEAGAKFINNRIPSAKAKPGDIVEVCETDDEDDILSHRVVKTGEFKSWVRKGDFEVVPDAPKRKFAVGDNVRVLTDDLFGKTEIHVGLVGTVYDVSMENEKYPYKVRFTDGTTMPYGDSEIAPSQDKPVVRTIARSNLRFTRKSDRIVVEANGKRVAAVSVEELREMAKAMEDEDNA